MDLPTLISLLLNFFGTTVAIGGAIYNALGFHRFALALWVASNGILLALFIGVAMAYLPLNGGAWLQVALYCVFVGTSSYGYWRIAK